MTKSDLVKEVLSLQLMLEESLYLKLTKQFLTKLRLSLFLNEYFTGLALQLVRLLL